MLLNNVSVWKVSSHKLIKKLTHFCTSILIKRKFSTSVDDWLRYCLKWLNKGISLCTQLFLLSWKKPPSKYFKIKNQKDRNTSCHIKWRYLNHFVFYMSWKWWEIMQWINSSDCVVCVVNATFLCTTYEHAISFVVNNSFSNFVDKFCSSEKYRYWNTFYDTLSLRNWWTLRQIEDRFK